MLVRRIVQACCYALFLLFVIAVPILAQKALRADWLMRLSPLSALGAMLSSLQFLLVFWPAAILLATALLLGRWFCGWACPLGTTLAISDAALARLKGSKPAPDKEGHGESREGDLDFAHLRWRRLKYYLLAVCFLAAVLGVSLFGFFDPLSIAARSFILSLHPYLNAGLQALAAVLAGLPLVGGAGAVATAASRDLLQAQTDAVFSLHLFTFLTLLAVLALGFAGARFWCRALCPLGALLGLAAQCSLTRRKVSDECIQCGRCAAACPMACISADGKSTLAGECILCLNCQAVCPVDAVRFLGPARKDQIAEVDVTRRGLIASAAAAAISYPVFRMQVAGKRTKGGALIRPPLAGRDEEQFLGKCLRCGQCMRVCPTGVIQPAGLEGGLESLWTPRLVPRPGHCSYECDHCGRACPSGAIPSFNLDEKHRTAIGLAFLNTSRCIPWRGWHGRQEEGVDWQQQNCGVCEEVCPVPAKAIHFRRVYPEGEGSTELRLPYVREELCVGCGFCESACPVKGKPVIVVTGGFRELAPPAKSVERPAIEDALPARIGELRLSGPKKTYKGPKELFDYIDGGADPYLHFNFVQVATALYVAQSVHLKIDLWEFTGTDDSFGAFARDRAGRTVKLGDEGALADSSLWAKKGRYMLSLLPMAGSPTAEQSVALARAVLDRLQAAAAPRPEICRKLPRAGLQPDTVRFARHAMHLQDVYLSDRYIPAKAFGLTGGAVAACGAYGLREDGRDSYILLVQHPSREAALSGSERMVEVREGWGETPTDKDGYTVFQAGEADFCAMGTAGSYFAAAFIAPDANAALQLLKETLNSAGGT